MGQPGLFEKFKDPVERLRDENARIILEAIEAWAGTKKVVQVEDLGSKLGFSATRVLCAKDVYESPHLRERGAMQEYDDSLYGEMIQNCYPPRLSETPGRLKWSSRPLGFDNEYVFTKLLGLTKPAIRGLQEEGVIFQWNPGIRTHCPPPDWDKVSGKKLS
jgi:crotonobetainyl-CoA:carnitine CoA-transferase CaiB-like acyl-CoA transferase